MREDRPYRAFVRLGGDELHLVATHLPVQALAALEATDRSCQAVAGRELRARKVNILRLRESPFELNGMGDMKSTDLSNRNIGDSEMRVFSDAVRSGALRQLSTLDLAHNQIGDIGIRAFADALGKGALAQLKRVNLDGNNIGDAGMMALGKAFSRGVLAQLEKFSLRENPFTIKGINAFEDGIIDHFRYGEMTPRDTRPIFGIVDLRLEKLS